ncbi:MAG: aspartyl/glutamyl-tRNA amidotransferase subunit A [Elusimicrobia bacterium RIFOXYA2_FULL_39_19]|nr:MAG: aspartyl/glutamyl-tRNA amidotransferase subunit A [Elusimicrobia bacterium RIFOXYA2_FULL_39_19]
MEIFKTTASNLAKQIKNKEITSLEVVSSFINRIKTKNEKLSVFLNVFESEALDAAKEIDKKISSGQPVGPLAGIPVAIKDNICIKNKPATCGSKILQNYSSPYDAAVIDKLKESGAVIIGKTNMDEFAMGSSTENSAFMKTKNPWNPDYVPGGSSGGSAAAVGSAMVPLAIGSDTGGSIRQPASCCSVVGMKPTYGTVSRYGLVAFASSLDQIGPFAKTVEDAALLLTALSGYDKKDSTSVNCPKQDFLSLIQNGDIKGLKIGLPKEYFIPGIDAEVDKVVKEAIKKLESLGAEIIDVSLPHTEYAVAVYYIIAPSEASANLARYDGIRYGYRSNDAIDLMEMYKKTRGAGFGPEVKRRIMLGTYALSSGYYDAYYAKAQKVRTLIKKDFDDVYKKVDVIVTPTTATPPFKFGEKTDDPLQMYLSDIFTISCNLAGLPGISIPCGFTKNNLPIGFQILGKQFDELTVLKAGYEYQKITDWHLKYPEG